MGGLATLYPIPCSEEWDLGHYQRERTGREAMWGLGSLYLTLYPTTCRRTGSWSAPERRDGERGDGGPGYPISYPLYSPSTLYPDPIPSYPAGRVGLLAREAGRSTATCFSDTQAGFTPYYATETKGSFLALSSTVLQY
jgi:hypothetical protein